MYCYIFLSIVKHCYNLNNTVNTAYWISPQKYHYVMRIFLKVIYLQTHHTVQDYLSFKVFIQGLI